MEYLDYPLIKTKHSHDERMWYFDLNRNEDDHSPKLEYDCMKIYLYYSKGGYGGFDWTKRPRGYYVALKPCSISIRDNGIYVESSTLMGKNSGGYIFLEETKRFNAKRLDTIQDLAQEKINEYAKSVLDALRV